MIPPPAIQGLGTSGGFEMQVEDRGGAGLIPLQTAVNKLLAAAASDPQLQRVNSTFRAGVPQLYADVDRAKVLSKQVPSIHEAAIAAARMRFRPILMTSFAFIFGVLPLVFATGVAAASRRSLGTAVCGGMLTSTILAVFFTPVFYVVFQWLSEIRKGRSEPT